METDWAGYLSGLAWFILIIGVIAGVICLGFIGARESGPGTEEINEALWFGIGCATIFSAIVNFIILQAAVAGLRALRDIAENTERRKS